MPKVSAKVMYVDRSAGKLFAKLQFNGAVPHVGDLVNVRWGELRTVPQNRLYFSYLRWLIEEAGLREHGHFSVQALHDDIKAYFLADKKLSRGEFKAIEEATTTDLTTKEFSDYIEKVRQFVHEFFEISDEVFWKQVEGK